MVRRPARSGSLRCGRLLAGVGLGGQRRLGPLDERVRWVGVEGDVLEPELPQPALAVLVAGRGDTDHRQTGGGQPRQRVSVQPAGAGGDDRRLGLAGGGHGEQVAQVVAAVRDLRGTCPAWHACTSAASQAAPAPAVTSRSFIARAPAPWDRPGRLGPGCLVRVVGVPEGWPAGRGRRWPAQGP